MTPRQAISTVFGLYLCAVVWAGWTLSRPKGQAVKYVEMTQMNDQDLQALYDYNEDPTIKAIISLEQASRRQAKREQERADMTPRVDCRPSFSNLSPREQIMRVNEVLNTPNEPDPRLQ